MIVERNKTTMLAIKAVIVIFILLETSNIFTMYFSPDSKKANAMGAFKAWEDSKQDPEIHNLLKYLVNWIAGTKLIFIVLLVMILLHGDDNILIFTGLTMALAISSFYWRLFPSIRKMDEAGNIEPNGYSKTLGMMIGVFIIVFLVATVISGLSIF